MLHAKKKNKVDVRFEPKYSFISKPEQLLLKST